MDKILIIEDEKLIREELEMLLLSAGFVVNCITDFDDVIGQIKISFPDLILMDINLPGQDGYNLCNSIRRFSSVPIVFITGRNTAMDELQALTLGGDDYITKPYIVPILIARINRLLKRGKVYSQDCLVEYRGVKFSVVAGTIASGEKEIELTKTELKIMYYLFRHANQIVSRLELIEYLWDNEIHIDDNTLSVNVMRLRDKLCSIGVDNFIQTKRGMGYKI